MSHRQLVCFTCSQPGHHQRDCPNRSSAPRSRLSSGPVPAFSGQKRGRDDESDLPGKDAPPVIPPLTETESRLKSLLIHFGDSSQSSPSASLSLAAQILMSELVTHQSFLQTHMLNCIQSLPHKTIHYACLCREVYLSSPEGAQFVTSLFSSIVSLSSQSLEANRFIQLKLFTRFLAGLTLCHLIAPEQLFHYLQYLFNLTIPSANSHSAAASSSSASDSHTRLHASQVDQILHILLSTLLHLADYRSKTEYQSLFTSIASRVSSRSALNNPLLRVFESEEYQNNGPLPKTRNPEDLLSNYCDAMKQEQNWSSNALSALPALVQSDKQFEAAEYPLSLNFRTATAHAAATADSKDNDESKDNPMDAVPVFPSKLNFYVSPSLRPDLTLFPQPEDESSRITPLNRFLVADWVEELMTIFEAIHREGAKQILALPVKFDFLPLAIETIIAGLFTLPRPTFRPVYYHALIIALFKAQPTVLPPIVGLLINTLFERLDELSIEIRDRFTHWFAFHLTNFHFTWPWDNWIGVLESDDLTPQLLFVRASLQKLVRLSYWDRVSQSLPEELLELMPHQPLRAFRYDEKNMDFIQDSQLYFQLAKRILQMIQQRQNAVELEVVLDAEIAEKLSREARIQIFIPCLLECGKQSYSHCFALMDRYKSTIAALTQEPVAQLAAVQCVWEFWQHSPQHVITIVDRLLMKHQFKGLGILQWAFSQTKLLSEAFLWELIELVLDRECRRLIYAAAPAAADSAAPSLDPYTIVPSQSSRVELIALFFGLFACFDLVLQHLKDSADMCTILLARCRQFAREFFVEMRWGFAFIYGELKKGKKDPRVLEIVEYAGKL